MLERWRRHLRKEHDAGSASMASYVVAAALFIVGSSYLVHFVIQPPGTGTANLQHAALKSQAVNALEVLLGSPGVPPAWHSSPTEIDQTFRVGLIEAGTTIRIEPAKFDALARGKLETSSTANGALDYAEIKQKLGLDGYEFHLRAYPLISPSAGAPYGVSGYEDFEVAYVGDIAYPTRVYSAAARQEAHALDVLGIAFDNVTRDADPNDGDVYMDDTRDIRDNLLPHIGNAIQQTIISAGSGTKYSFHRVNASTYATTDLIAGTPGLTGSAMALSQEGGAVMGYNKNRELRTIVGKIDMSGGEAELSWDEWVDTDRGNGTYDCGDYGFVEVSIDNGRTWTSFDDPELRSRDCSDLTTLPLTTPHGITMRDREIDIEDECPACVGKTEVLVAYHWVSDNDNNVGYGWVVDNVLITDDAGDTLLRKTFEAPTYSMLIVGSHVDHDAFVAEDVKDAIRDYVDRYGGRILIVGGTDNANWLMRLFDAGVEGSGGGIATPDVTHPLLTLPNELDYGRYTTGTNPPTTWDFSGSDDADLFHMIAGTDADHHVLTVSQQGAWGDTGTSEGAVILTTYLPYQLDQEEMRRFFANNIVYGRYHYLYLEVGPTVPDGEAVASVSRTATMNMYRDGAENYTEMAFIMYVWPGVSAADTLGAAAIDPTPPQLLAATAGTGATPTVSLTWQPPASTGTGTPTKYHVFRGTSPSTITNHIGTVAYVSGSAPLAFVDDGSVRALVEGVTYYYNVTLAADHSAPVETPDTDDTHGTPSDPASATPFGRADPPTILDAVGGPTHITVTWSPPADTGGGTIFGYALYACAQSCTNANAYTLAGEVGDAQSYAFPGAFGESYLFMVKALNAWGWSEFSAPTTVPKSTIAFAVAPELTVTESTLFLRNTLTWAAPTDLGSGALSGYNVWRNQTGSAASFELLTYLNSAANASFLDANVTPGTPYSYKVQAVTTAGDGLLSDAKSGTTASVPGAPTGLARTNFNSLLRTITMGWTAPSAGSSPILHYEVYRGATAGTESYLGTALTTSYTDITPGTGTWYYKVRAVSAIGNGPFSSSVSMKAS